QSHNRDGHFPTVCRVTPRVPAIMRLERPVAHSITMRELWASACAFFGRRAHSSSRSRSSAAKLKGAIGLPVRIRVPPPIRRTLADYNLFNVFITQDTRVISHRH